MNITKRFFLTVAILLSFPFYAHSVDVYDFPELLLEATSVPAATPTTLDLQNTNFPFTGVISIAAGRNITFNSAAGPAVFDGMGGHQLFNAVAAPANQSTLTFNNISFQNAANAANGGAIYSTNSALNFLGDNVVFSGNHSMATGVADGGGAIYLAGNGSNVVFGTSAADSFTASSNTAVADGAFLLGTTGVPSRTVVFNATSYFNSNIADRRGGVIYMLSGSLAFNADATFTDNHSYATSSRGGGALYLTSVDTTFAGLADFSGNTAGSNGGALDVQTNTMTFNGITSFTNNSVGEGLATVSRGGAIFAAGSTLEFYGSQTSFIGNSIKSTSTASQGGAIFARNSPSATSTYSNLTFGQTSADTFIAQGNSTARGSGGFLYSDGANTITFNATSLFGGDGAGEANSAVNGGAVYLANGTTATFTNARFIGNTASTAGGAIYAVGTAGNITNITFNTEAAGETLFQGNKAAGASNALYIGDYTNITFDTAAGGNVYMDDAIASAVVNSGVINIDGDGTFNLNAMANTANVDYNLSGGVFKLGETGGLTAGNFTMTGSAVFDMQNDFTNNVYLSSLSMGAGNTLKMSLIDNVPTNDKIFVSGSAALAGAFDLAGGVGNYEDTRVDLIESASSGITGTFSTINITPIGFGIGPAPVWTEFYDPDVFYLMLTMKSGSDLTGLSGLSHNKSQVANVFDAISSDLAPLDGMAEVINNVIVLDEAGQRAALEQLSGSFLPNVITAPLLVNGRHQLYGRIQPRQYQAAPGCNCANAQNLWLQGYGSYEKYKADENSFGSFSSATFGTQLGWDFISSEQSVAGLYLNYARINARQSASRADIQNIGGGLYGGLFGDKWQFKGSLSAGLQDYDTKRKLEFIGIGADASFKGYSVNADMQAGYKTEVADNLFLMPFLGLTAGYLRTEAFTETGIAGLKADAADYFRGTGFAGAELSSASGKFSWRAHTMASLLAFGRRGEMNMAFTGGGDKMKIYGSEQGIIQIGAGAGAEYAFSKNWAVYGGADLLLKDKGYGYEARLGVNYRFCAGGKTCIIKEDARREPVMLKEEAPAPAPTEKAITPAQFGFDSRELSPSYKIFLEQTLAQIELENILHIKITGHTDSVGTQEYNQNLSEQRAEAVAAYLYKLGVPRGKMTTSGKGKAEPVASNKTKEGRAKNRRAELSLLVR